jgi:hypothetical protein
MILVAVAGLQFPVAGTYKYAASLNGQPVGQWTVSVKQADAGTEIDESSSASLAGMQLSATATLMLGPDLAPTKYDGNYHTPNQNPTVGVALSPSLAVVTGSLTGGPRNLALGANTRHFVVIEPGLLAGLFALPAQVASWREPSMTWIAPVTAQAQSLAVDSSASSTRPSAVPPQDAAIAIQAQTPLTIWYDPATLVSDEIIIPSQNAVLTRER